MGKYEYEVLWNMIETDEITRYMGTHDFIDEDAIEKALHVNERPDPKKIHDILEKSLHIETLRLY